MRCGYLVHGLRFAPPAVTHISPLRGFSLNLMTLAVRVASLPVKRESISTDLCSKSSLHPTGCLTKPTASHYSTLCRTHVVLLSIPKFFGSATYYLFESREEGLLRFETYCESNSCCTISSCFEQFHRMLYANMMLQINK